MKVRVLVATHKVFPMPQDKNLYYPVLVGSFYNYKSDIFYQRDDRGENISKKNPCYNELTAVYWAWKNMNDYDAIGLVHYRRFFIKKGCTSNLKNVIDKNDVIRLLSRADVVLPRKRNYFVETIHSHYIHSHHKEPLDATKNVLTKIYPSYVHSFDKVMSRKSAHMFNMFIMRKNFFNEYCEWLFDVLNHVEKEVNITSYSKQEKRVFGYLSELLLDIWIDKNKISYVENNWGMIGKQHVIKKGFFMVLRKFNLGGSQTHFN